MPVPRSTPSSWGPTFPWTRRSHLADQLRIQRPTLYLVLVREVVDTEVLTRAMHSGVREVVADSDMAAIGSALDRAEEVSVALRGNAPAPRLGKVLTVFSPKGGVGKTTTSVNLALCLAHAGRSVCLVDMDLAFGDVAITLQLFPTTLDRAPDRQRGIPRLRPGREHADRRTTPA